MADLRLFHGPNAGYVFGLYERFLADPSSVDAGWRGYFESFSPEEPAPHPEAGVAGASDVVIGMAHRGRLNVLRHVLGKPYAMIIAGFAGAGHPHPLAEDDFTGDVKYHTGWRDTRQVGGHEVGITLAPSPSHLEFVNPVVHVNADDVQACLAVAKLAFAYRERYRKDFVIDLVGYRRWGHNEGDEPAFAVADVRGDPRPPDRPRAVGEAAGEGGYAVSGGSRRDARSGDGGAGSGARGG
jgi:2-oxoglutarate dehydrogenase complex dehydrogenase (E1) component-like enzyme